MGLLSWLFGGNRTAVRSEPSSALLPIIEPAGADGSPQNERATTRYYDTMSRMQAAAARGDFEDAARLVRENLQQIPAWAKETRQDYGAFDIGSIPAFDQGGRILALLGDDDGLAELRRIITNNPELARWAELIEQRIEDRRLFEAILSSVNANPGCLQVDVKGLIGESDGHRVATLIGYLERAGSIARIKSGRTYKLLPAGSAEIPPAAPKRIVASHRIDTTPPRLRELDISKLAYIPLPRSPLRWEEIQAGRARAMVLEASEDFEVRDADWRISSLEKIPPGERPDPAFRQTYPRVSGLLLVDDLGKADGLGQIAAAGLCYDRTGSVTAKAALHHGIYRFGANAIGQGVIAMSAECVVHAYGDDLVPSFETTLSDAPEVRAIRKRFEIGEDQLKNHIRCVALSRDASRYLFTVVDEAWCIGADGRGIWGAKLPAKDGWTRVAESSEGAATSADVDHALTLMGLALPITPEEVKQRYRGLAKQWHPDLNGGDPGAAARMKSLNAAMEVLTGIGAAELPQYTGTRFYQELSRSEFDAGGQKFSLSVGMTVGEIYASDWIYAASFAGLSDSVFLAGYSGRIVQVDENGAGVRLYDIGAVPRSIVDTGDYLYVLTDTRLYVLQNETLHAIVDTFDGGDLIVATNGFGLLEKKRLRWYSSNGRYVGSVVSKDPIRRVYCAQNVLVIESRQRRAIVDGAPDWWA